MPSAITLFASGHKPAGEPRRSALSSIQIMSPWAPDSSQARSRSAVSGAESARATPNAQKPSARAFSSNSERSFVLPVNIFYRYEPVLFGDMKSSASRSSDRGQRPRQILRRQGGGERDRPRRPPGRHLRYIGAERRRENHHASNAARDHRARRRPADPAGA